MGCIHGETFFTDNKSRSQLHIHTTTVVCIFIQVGGVYVKVRDRG